ncbi:MAG: nitrophenyl compound nitroreductase subunit ArsF family protein [Phycisphaerales bacterium]|jgi:hypothetical protein
MKAKQVLTILLLVFLVGSLAYMVVKENKIESSTDITASPQEQSTNTEQDIQLIVYYFHGDVRCVTCHKLENYAKEVLEINFSDAITSGSIIWKPVNVDKPENKHFIQDYELVTKSIVLSRIVDGKETKWKNLDQIWQKVADKNEYLQYIHNDIVKFLEETKS